MKIGFYLENENYSNIDFSHPESGNPGVRGTQYMMWIIACKMAEQFDVFMFAPCVKKMPNSMKNYQSLNEIDAIEKAKSEGVDIFVLRASNEKADLYKNNICNGMKYVLWSHNFEDYHLLNVIAKNDNIKRLVCVGRQQYERLRDHKVFQKSIYIYNALDLRLFDGERNSNRKIVTYIGALNDQKGFHILARVWKKICNIVPDAELYILGSGNMGNSSELGPFKLAEKKYERRFINYLIDKNGEILPNVHFLGSVGGKEKDKIIQKTCVGVANPSGIGETFCLVATEFEAFGVPVVSKNGYGLLDTVINGKTGLLINNDNELVNAIVTLLSDIGLNNMYGINGRQFVRQNFQLDLVVQQWIKLFESVSNDEKHTVCYEYNYPNNQFKILREYNRRLQTKGFKTPSILIFEYIKPKMLKTILNFKNKVLRKK